MNQEAKGLKKTVAHCTGLGYFLRLLRNNSCSEELFYKKYSKTVSMTQVLGQTLLLLMLLSLSAPLSRNKDTRCYTRDTARCQTNENTRKTSV